MQADGSGTKQVLRDLQKNKPTIKVPFRQYKQAYSDLIWKQVEALLDENEHLQKRSERLEDLLKMVVQQSQLGVNEVRNLHKALAETTASLKALKALPAPEANGEVSPEIDPLDHQAEEVDLKGE